MKNKNGTKKLLAVGLIGAFIAMLVAVWKASKPIEDPWENETSSVPEYHPVNSREASVEELRETLNQDK